MLLWENDKIWNSDSNLLDYSPFLNGRISNNSFIQQKVQA